MDSNTLNTLLEKFLTLLERFYLVISTWYGASITEKAKTAVTSAKELTDDINEKNKLKEQIKGMTRDEKIKLTVSDD